MAAADGASSISVTVRVRPFTIREAAQLVKHDDTPLFLGDGSLAAAPTPKLSQKGIRSVIKVVDEKCLVFDPPEDNPVQRFSKSIVPQGKRVKDQTFAFDRVFDENTNQSDVYEATTKSLLDSVLDGYNATVFAYGATGCGKTHTITGTAQQPGIIFLTMQELFERINDLQEEKTCEISLSYLEIYNETIRDLLVQGQSGPKQGLMLREDANQAVSVAGLSSHHPQNVEEVMEMLVMGNINRTMSPTEANATSSRSHAVLQINVSTKDRNAGVNEPHTMATLSIIDLAGSERASATKNRGERLVEGANINRSLLALGSCINALCDPRKRNHVPYRNSKLTRLLKFSLGGNCRTVMIVCVSPSSVHFDETQNTLRYANRAKNIQTKVTRNVFNVNRHVKDFVKRIDEQMQQIKELQEQQKDYEKLAFAKFKKQSEKRDGIAKEAILRLRSAYDNSSAERQERLTMMKKQRQIERRISLISAWIADFDQVCETREEEEPPKNLVGMRKTATGILMELESSRQHYHQRIGRTNWERAINTALEIGIKQMTETDGLGDATEISNLRREAELLKSMADREAYSVMLEQEKGGDAALVQLLLQAHFDTVAIISQIMEMDEADAVRTARKLLGKMLQACSDATSQVIKPDGGIPLPVTECFAPSKTGTPKRRKPVNVMEPSPMAAPLLSRPSPLESVPHLMASSPMKSSPRRRKVMGSAKKGVSFTPKKKSPAKGSKRGVRWRDDTEEGGALADFQATPKQLDVTPEVSSQEVPIPALPSMMIKEDSDDSSPIPAPPEASMDLKPRSSRFQTGFLSKKSDGSPPTFTRPSLLSSSSAMTAGRSSSSDSDASPLREIAANAAPHSSSLSSVRAAVPDLADSTPNDSCAGSDSDSGRSRTAHSYTSSTFPLDASDAKRVRTALHSSGAGKRISTSSSGPASAGMPMSASRAHRRRSPTGSSLSGSPPSENLFSASHARRMVRSSDRDVLAGVLSPRTDAIVKTGRRTTIGLGASRAGSGGGSGDEKGSVKASAGGAAALMGHQRQTSRGSLMVGSKSAWR